MRSFGDDRSGTRNELERGVSPSVRSNIKANKQLSLSESVDGGQTEQVGGTSICLTGSFLGFNG